MSLLEIEGKDVTKRVWLFPLSVGTSPTWYTVLHFKKAYSWTVILGNVVFGGLMCYVFIPAVWRFFTDGQIYTLLRHYPLQLLALAIFILTLAYLGLLSLINAVKLARWLLSGRRIN